MATRPKLGPEIANHGASPLIEKGFLSGKYVRLSKLLVVGSSIFRIGALWGRRYKGQLSELVSVYGISEPTKHLAEIQRYADELAALLPSAQSFFELFVISEMRSSSPARPIIEWAQWLRDAGKEKVPPEAASFMLYLNGFKGIALGAYHPDQVKSLLVGGASITPELASEYEEFTGLVSELPSLDDMERDAVTIIQEFCSTSYPELKGVFV